MWVLRRASNPFKIQTSSIAAFELSFSPSYKTASVLWGDREEASEPTCVVSGSCLCFKNAYHSVCAPSDSKLWIHSYSLQSSRKRSSKSDHLEDGFLELGALVDGDVGQVNQDSEFSEDEEENRNLEGPMKKETEVSDTMADANENNLKKVPSELFLALVTDSTLSVDQVIEKWVEEGKKITREEFLLAMIDLRRREMYKMALQLSECIEKCKHFDFVERDYSSRLDLVAKVRGIRKAELYINQIPESFRGELTYRTLLASYAASRNEKKSEEIFNKMRKLEFPLTTFVCNQMILLYKRLRHKKLFDVLVLMEKENVKPDITTYKLLIDTKGRSNDMAGIDRIVEVMKGEGTEPDLQTQAITAKHYINGGFREKAEAIVKGMEGGDILENRQALFYLLPLYAALGKTDEVERLWKVCLMNPRPQECLAAIEAWGTLKNIDEAEAAFDTILKTGKKLTSRHYNALLTVYANQKMPAKVEHLVKRMADNGCVIVPTTVNAIVRLHVDAGDLEKALSLMQKFMHQRRTVRLFSSFMLIMEQYAKRGDVHNCENICRMLREAGCVMGPPSYLHLVQAYMNAKAPAYGMQDRMRADNVIPSNHVAGMLARVDPFRKTSVSDILD